MTGAPLFKAVPVRARRLVRRYLDRLELLVGPRLTDLLGLRQRRFERARQSGIWSPSGESVSGAGSGLAATESIRRQLPSLLTKLNVEILLDVPCGDWNWMAHVDLPVQRYIGGDIVPSLISANNTRYGRPDREFKVIDLCVDALPAADLLLCRDALLHFSEADIWRTIANIKRAKITYLAATTFTATVANTNQATGLQWRHLNLQTTPFQFPEPLHVIVDNYNRDDQRLMVWRVSDLPRQHTARFQAANTSNIRARLARLRQLPFGSTVGLLR